MTVFRTHRSYDDVSAASVFPSASCQWTLTFKTDGCTPSTAQLSLGRGQNCLMSVKLTVGGDEGLTPAVSSKGGPGLHEQEGSRWLPSQGLPSWEHVREFI